MEVPGKTISTGENNTLCNICEDDDKVTHADGFCEECEEYMCSTCFDKHKKRKISRHHEFTDLNEVQSLQENKGSDDLEKCKLHCNEVVKFYCSHHEKIGCGDCMIFEHKSCRVEYIRDKARQFKDSQDCKDLIRRAEKCHLEAEEMFTSLKSNKIQVVDIHDKFTRDVNAFKEEMILHVTKLTNDMLKQGEDIKAMDMKSIDKLEKETEGVMNETSRLSDVFVSYSDRPQKLFVSSVLQKPKLNGLREQLDNIKGKNKISVYEFSCDGNLERSVKDCKQLGNMQTIKQSNKADIKEKVRPKEIAQHVPVPVLPKPQDAPAATDVRVSPLSPEKMQVVEDALKKPRCHTG
ncbi:transcription intermediary factor 1-alpha-like, partial [Mercenaria mercenaria]|uniref:transcription intermediary factor 1-alpha-like n=1 Tax=Mercenaria mercenaria TaxID=6596 RepID=UPI00234F9B6D